MTWHAGDEVIFFHRRYTLLHPTGNFGWLGVETDNPDATPKVILTEYLQPAPAKEAL